MGVEKFLMESEFDGSRDIPLTDIMLPKNLTHTEKKKILASKRHYLGRKRFLCTDIKNIIYIHILPTQIIAKKKNNYKNTYLTLKKTFERKYCTKNIYISRIPNFKENI